MSDLSSTTGYKAEIDLSTYKSNIISNANGHAFKFGTHVIMNGFFTCSSNTGSVLFTLPASFRPSQVSKAGIVVAKGAGTADLATIQIATNGEITCGTANVTAGVFNIEYNTASYQSNGSILNFTIS